MSGGDAVAGHRLHGLDALRGIAALAVLTEHSGFTPLLVPHGYLAVDFFFILSGYVIAAAYEHRLAGGMSTRAFLWQRLERLYPMLFIGAAIGLATVPIIERDGYYVPYDISWRCAVIAQFLLVPFVCGGWAFILNGVQWSILYELLANVAHAMLLRRLGTVGLAIWVAAAALALLWLSDRTGVDGGWARENVVKGTVRVAYDYAAGILLFRLRHRWRRVAPRVPLVALVVVLALCLLWPEIPGFGARKRDLVSVVVIFPAIVALATAAGGGRVATWLGFASYPLYAIHFPLLVANSWIATKLPDDWGTQTALNTATFTGIVILSLLLGRYVDLPLNRWRRRQRSHRTARV